MDMFAMFQLLVGVYLIVCAITGRGQLYTNDYLKCSREQYVKVMRILAAVTGGILTVTNGLGVAGLVPPASALNWILWALGFLPILAMAVYSSKMTDREAAKRGSAAGRADKPAAKDPLRAAFVFDEEESEENDTGKNG